jgi:mono/diheme cytochrome c family protein
MVSQKKLSLFLLFLISPFLFLSAQMKQFVAPKTADALVNSLKDNASATAEGKKIYITYCGPCHGDKGKGDGVASAGLSKPPADHTSAAVQKQTDGAIFWKISEGNNPMPSYKKALSETQIWQLVDYIRTLSKTSKK